MLVRSLLEPLPVRGCCMLPTTNGKCLYRPTTLSDVHTSTLLVQLTTREVHSRDFPEKCSGPIGSGLLARNWGPPEEKDESGA